MVSVRSNNFSPRDCVGCLGILSFRQSWRQGWPGHVGR